MLELRSQWNASLVAHHAQSRSSQLKTFVQNWRHWKTSERRASVLLLVGVSGIGKSVLIQHLAKAILCQGVNPSFPLSGCLCLSCTQWESQIHCTNLWRQEDQDSIGIDAFRALQQMQGLAPLSDQPHVILLPNAEKMTPSAANSVLKLMEEPPAHWVFLLSAPDEARLLPTLVSRCHVLRLNPLSQDEIETLLLEASVTPDRALICSELGRGSLERAWFFANPGGWDFRQTFLECVGASFDAKRLQSFMDQVSGNAAHEQGLLDLLEQLLLELFRWAGESSQAFQVKRLDEKKALGRVMNCLQGKSQKQILQTLNRHAQRLARARQEVKMPLNRKLWVQELMIPWGIV